MVEACWCCKMMSSFCSFLPLSQKNVHSSCKYECQIVSRSILKVKIEPFKFPYSPILNSDVLLQFQNEMNQY